MSFRGDRRGQAIQIGAVLLLGALVLAFSMYQAFVVPDQNESIEFKHSQEVQGQLQQLRNALVSTGDGAGGQSVSIELGTQYPSRLVALNPPDPSGAIATVGTARTSINATVAHAKASGETGDFWDGQNRTYNTGAIAYRPGYNEYGNAPETWYEHSVLYNRFSNANLTLTGQRLVDGDRISLVTVNGSFSRSRTGTVSLDVRPVSAATTTVSITNETASTNVTVTVPTRLNESDWETLLDGEFVEDGGHVVRLENTTVPGEDYRLLHVIFERGVTYDLNLARAGVGTGVVDPETAYLTDVAGNGSTVPEGGTVQVTVEVRDRLDNPVGDTIVYAGTQGGGSSVTPTQSRTDSDGELILTYEAPDEVDGVSQRTDRINASLTVPAASVDDADFDPTTVANVSLTVKVDNTDGSGMVGGGGGGAFAVNWQDPSSESGVTCPSGTDGVCTLDGSVTETVNLTAKTSPAADGATIDFASNDSSLVGLSPTTNTTDAAGETLTTLTASQNGAVTVFASGGGSGDGIEFRLENFAPRTLVDDFEGASTLSNNDNWTAGGSGDTGIRSDGESGRGTISDSPTNAAYIENTTSDNTLTSRTVSTDGNSQVYLEFAVKEGDDVSAPDSGASPAEDLVVEYRDDTGSWVEFDRVTPTGSEGSYQTRTSTLTDAAALHGSFQLRFRQPGGSQIDPWYVDDVCVAPDAASCSSDTTAPSISGFAASNPSGRDVQVTFDSDEQLNAIDVAISGAESGSLTEADFTETDNGDGTYTYSGTYAGSSDGTYTATLDTATDAAGNDGASGQSDSVTVDTTAPSVTVAQPNGGETLAGGSTYTIQWSATDSGSGIAVNSVDIAYSTDDGGSWTTIATGEADDGSYSWTVPSVDTTSALVRVSADDNDGQTGTDQSDGTFTIDSTAPSISGFTASNPTGRDVTVTFDSDEQLSTIDVGISGAESGSLTTADFGETDNGDGTYTYSATYSGSSDGTYTATLNTAADAAGNDGASGQSDSITVDTTAPSVTVSQPNGGETITSGSTYTIQWSATDGGSGVAANSVDIAYSTDGGSSWTTIATGETNDGSYTWTVSAPATTSGLVRVNATDNSGNTGTDQSDGPFSIVGPIDSFEDGTIGEYTGDTNQFNVVTSDATDGTQSLEASPTGNAVKQISSTTGLPNYPHQGDTFAYDFQITSTGNKNDFQGVFGFGQTTAGNNYEIRLVQQTATTYVVEVDNGNTISTSAPFTLNLNQWYGVSIDWGTSTVDVTISDGTGTTVVTQSVASAGDGGGNYISFGSRRGTMLFDNVRITS